MKIVFFSNKNVFYENSAYSNRIRGLFDYLNKREVSIHILVLHGIWSIEESKFHKSFQYPDNIKVYYNYLPFLIRFLKRLKQNRIVFKLFDLRLKTLLKNDKVDFAWINLGIVNDPKNSILKTLKKNKIKIIQELSEHPEVMLNEIQLKKYWNHISTEVELFFMMTRSLIQLFEEKSLKKAIYYHIPMTVDFSRFEKFKDYKKGNNKHENIITYVGLMNNKKDGVHILLQAFAEMRKKYNNLKLILVGPKEPIEDYSYQSELIKELELESHVIYLGSVERSRIPELLMKSTCLVLARPSSKQASFGFPTKLGEYLASANPVVVTDTGEITDYLRDGISAYISRPDSALHFAQKLDELFSNLDKALIIGQRGMEVAKECFDSAANGEKIFMALRENLV